MSLFVAGVHASLFVAGAAFGEVHVSLFVAGAAFGEIWNDSPAGNVVIFNRICSCRARNAPSVARRVAVCVFMVGSFSDHGRIGRALEMTRQPFFGKFLLVWECNFAWQAQYLVRLEGAACCSAHCK